MTDEELLDRLFAAIGAGDLDAVRELYADDVEVWHNVSRRASDREAGVDLLRDFIGRVETYGYEVVERRFWPGGAVQRHLLRVVSGGREHEIHACLAFAFAGGRIARVFEYVDGRALARAGLL